MRWTYDCTDDYRECEELKVGGMDEKCKNLERALDEAVEVIKSYEMDCRHLEEYLKENDPNGFCQGSIYSNALKRIEKLKRGNNGC